MLHPRFLRRRAGGRARRRSPPAGERKRVRKEVPEGNKSSSCLPVSESCPTHPPTLCIIERRPLQHPLRSQAPSPREQPTNHLSVRPRRPLGRRHPPLRLDTTARVRLLFVRTAAAGPFLVQFWGEGGETRTSFLPLQFTFWGALKGRKTSPLFFVDDAYFLTPLPFPPVSSPLIRHRPCFRCCGVFCRI